MKRIIIISVALILSSFLFTSCQKAKESEPPKQTQVQTSETQQSLEQKTENQIKQAELPTEIKSPLTEEEQKEFDEYGGEWVTPEVFGNDEKEAIKILKILIKGDHKTIRWYRKAFPQLPDSEIKKLYGSNIGDALSVINPKTNKEGFNLAIEILKTKKEYPEAMVTAAIALKVAQDKKAIPLLREVVKHPNPTVRLQAAGSLIMLGDADTALPILNELAEKEGLSGALYLLFTGPGKIIDERGYAIVEKALKYPGAEVRISAVKLLLESKKIIKEKAEEVALGIVNELKDKTLKDYGLVAINPKESIDVKALPSSNIDVGKADKQHSSDSRACDYTISMLGDLKSKQAIPLLKHIHEKNTGLEYVCHENLGAGGGIARGGGGIAENTLKRILENRGSK